MPAVIAPSPITAMRVALLALGLGAPGAMPSAAEIEVDECAVPKVSYSLARRGKPEMPSYWRSVVHRSRRPVRILWG